MAARRSQWLAAGGLVLVATVAAAAVVLVFEQGSNNADRGAVGAGTPTTPAPARAAPMRASRTYTVTQMRSRFRRETGLPLVVFDDASTAQVTSLRSRPHFTPRFGEFQIFVFRPAEARRMTRIFTNGVHADRMGVHWVPDRAGGWIAVTVHARNMLVGWFPSSYGSRRVDASWRRLQGVVARLL